MRNLTLLTDLYELTMMSGYLKENKQDQWATFDVFYRKSDTIDMCIFAGLEQVIDYINNLRFTPDDIDYLRGLNIFEEDFLKALENFSFTGDIYSVREGEVVFAGEPIMTVRAPIFEAQFIETAILNMVNHQTLIATKASKIVRQAKGASIMEFGARRAQGPDAAIYGSRASIIGGCDSTSNVIAAKMFDVPASGTHAHSWVMSFPTELDAFRAYARLFPTKCLLLVDTYDTLGSGVPNAIKVFDELRAQGYEPLGIRLDSGDLAYLSKKARQMLDEAGYPDAIICASGDIDEYILASLNLQGAKIDLYGIGTKLVTALPVSALGGVYKLAELMEDGVMVPKIKLSDTRIKMTNPGFKSVYRLYNKDGMAEADLITLKDESIDETSPLEIFDPIDTWKRMTLKDFTARELHVQVYDKGKQVYFSPTVREIRDYAKKCQSEIFEENLRLTNPHVYKVDLSQKLYDLKHELLTKKGNR